MLRPLAALVCLTVAGAINVIAQSNHDAREPSSTLDDLHLVIARPVAEQLGILADSLGVETTRCLIGITRGSSAVVDLVWTPETDSTSHDGDTRCPLATIAVWHNRVTPSLENPAAACFLRASDIQAALGSRSPGIQIVQVTSDVACWWTRDQIEKRADAKVLMSLPGQRRGPVHSPPAGCRGTLPRGHVCARSVWDQRGRWLPVRFIDS